MILHGNNRTSIFYEEVDYRFYIGKLRLACKKHDCDIHAYVLMTNHEHLFIEKTGRACGQGW
ncbi:transposase [Nitrosospira briensis]|uniref:transposase n=1 Tax=Nitrosospira briensis TaxID=35799 RepID=UPI0009E40EE7